MKRQMAEMRHELDTLKSKPSQTSESTPVEHRADSTALSALNTKVEELASLVHPGDNKLVISGNASATFAAGNHGDTGFGADFSPILLWQLNDKLLFEGELELELEDGETVVNLEYAQLDWTISDHFTLVLGKFLSPMNIFVERYEPKWINKLPDTPLAIYDGILPETNVGIQLRGTIPVWGSSRINLAAFASNAPRLITDDPEELGLVEFDNFDSGRHNIAVGGRIGLEFCPNFEVGYGVEYARGQDGSDHTSRVLLQSVDLQGWVDALRGRWTLLSQYAWSDVGRNRFELASEEDSAPELISFRNKRDGGYVQLSYRGKQWDSDLLNRLEFVVRADRFNQPNNAPGSFDESRWTLGVDYWLSSYTVIKAAYEFESRERAENGNTLLIGIATGL
ncbi:hypothetical protein ACXR0O_07415 [Verrucomicrobiota bacterium sgz303538]